MDVSRQPLFHWVRILRPPGASRAVAHMDTSGPQLATFRRGRSYFIPHFDGLRGAGALVVFLAHIAVAFFPSLTSGQVDMSGLTALSRLSRTPVNLLTAGNFAVCVFFVLSGYVMAQMMSRTGESFPAVSVRRYLRLALPALASCLISAALLRAHLYFNQSVAPLTGSTWLKQWFDFPGSLREALKEGALSIFRLPTSVYNSNLWTMYTELWASILIFALFLLARTRTMRFVMLLIMLAYFRDQYAFVCFTCGAIWHQLHTYSEAQESLEGNRVVKLIRMSRGAAVSTIMVALGFFLGSYPDFAPFSPGGRLYAWLPHPTVTFAYWYHAFGAMLVVYFLGTSLGFRRLFSSRPMLFLGRISFSLYLIHLPLICSFGCWWFAVLQPLGSYNGMATLTVVTLIPAGIVTAMLFYKLVDLPALELSRRTSRLIDGRLGKD
jgi:peptidoglycan/LPS O-acetylase OafA/YrhL